MSAESPGIRKLLVANRGEIAVRIFGTCRRLGLGTVAVYAEDDAGAFHTRRADEAIPIASYLDPAELIRAARKAAPTESTPATASWPRTPTSRRPSSLPGSSSLAHRRER